MKIAEAVSIVSSTRNPVSDEQHRASLRDSSEKMESAFLAMVIKSMQKTLSEGPLGEKKNNMASMLFSTVLSDAIAKAGGLGMAEKIEEGLTVSESGQLDMQDLEVNPLIYQKATLLEDL